MARGNTLLAGCPRLPAWEDAAEGCLVRVEPSPGVAMADSPVRPTPCGEALAAAEDRA